MKAEILAVASGPDRQCADGRRADQEQRRRPVAEARPRADRRRALHGAFSRRQWRRETDRSVRAEARRPARPRFSRARRAPTARSFSTRTGARATSPKCPRSSPAASRSRAQKRRRQRPRPPLRKSRLLPRLSRRPTVCVAQAAPVASTQPRQSRGKTDCQVQSARDPAGRVLDARCRDAACGHRSGAVTKRLLAPVANARAGPGREISAPSPPSANARVARAYEVLSPNMVRSLIGADRAVRQSSRSRRICPQVRRPPRGRAPRSRASRCIPIRIAPPSAGRRSLPRSAICGRRRPPMRRGRASGAVRRVRGRPSRAAQTRAQRVASVAPPAPAERAPQPQAVAVRDTRGGICVGRAARAVPGHQAECARAVHRRLSLRRSDAHFGASRR